jgi:hypothetical protein
MYDALALIFNQRNVGEVIILLLNCWSFLTMGCSKIFIFRSHVGRLLRVSSSMSQL